MSQPQARNRLVRGLVALALACAVPCWACGDDDDDNASRDASIRTPDAVTPGARDGGGDGELDCTLEDDGTECDDGRHCVDGVCEFDTCGDGLRTGSEQCDDGNEAAGDGCDPACASERSGCGNARIDDDEECDDGNAIDDDACSDACTTNACGNERVDPGEECDDGNSADGDDCSAVCREIRCRNGRLDPGEECDDGDADPANGCTNRCRIELCGNGEQEGAEECDDGNVDDTDECSNACQMQVCGNGRVDPGEQCDSTPSCTEQCTMGEDLCTPCEVEHCTDFMDLGVYDLLKGCYEGMPPPDVALEPGTADEFARDCRAAVECARREGCVDPLVSPDARAACYCGSADVNVCAMEGPAEDAACAAEWNDAARAADNAQVQLRMADFSFPLGWATYLLTCDFENCREECLGLPPLQAP